MFSKTLVLKDMDHRFTWKERLHKRKEFQKVFDEGKIFNNEQIKVFALLNNSPVSRLGLVVGRKFGNAVKRNRFKRIFREAYRLNKRLLENGIDLIILPRPGLVELSLNSIEEKFVDLLTQINKQMKDEIPTN